MLSGLYAVTPDLDETTELLRRVGQALQLSLIHISEPSRPH